MNEQTNRNEQTSTNEKTDTNEETDINEHLYHLLFSIDVNVFLLVSGEQPSEKVHAMEQCCQVGEKCSHQVKQESWNC